MIQTHFKKVKISVGYGLVALALGYTQLSLGMLNESENTPKIETLRMQTQNTVTAWYHNRIQKLENYPDTHIWPGTWNAVFWDNPTPKYRDDLKIFEEYCDDSRSLFAAQKENLRQKLTEATTPEQIEDLVKESGLDQDELPKEVQLELMLAAMGIKCIPIGNREHILKDATRLLEWYRIETQKDFPEWQNELAHQAEKLQKEWRDSILKSLDLASKRAVVILKQMNLSKEQKRLIGAKIQARHKKKIKLLQNSERLEQPLSFNELGDINAEIHESNVRYFIQKIMQEELHINFDRYGNQVDQAVSRPSFVRIPRIANIELF